MKQNLQPLIFIVDDDIFYLKLTEQNLKSAGYTRLLTFASGDECINHLHLLPDIILLDYNMPESNGIEVLKKIKSVDPDAYVFFLSAQEEIEIAVDSIKQGAVGYVVKNQSTFTNILEEIEGVVNHQVDGRYGNTARMKGFANDEQPIQADQALEQLVYSTSHDLRGSLTSMLGLIKLAQIEADNFNKHIFLEMIEETVKKLDHTVKEIINSSASNRMAVKCEEINLQTLVSEVFKPVSFEGKNAVIEKKVIVEQNGAFCSDNDKLKIILGNLVSNAIRYHDLSKELPFVMLTFQVDAEKATISLTDNGCGIDNASMDKILTVLSQSKSQSDGSGLGLYIVKETINKLKGTIEVTSRIGEGTTFRLEIPNHRISIEPV